MWNLLNVFTGSGQNPPIPPLFAQGGELGVQEQNKNMKDSDAGDRGLKRSRSDSSDEEEEVVETAGRPPKKPKRADDFIYQTMFLNGEGSDVTIKALGTEWKLHRVFLKQCGYFEAMFNGPWEDANKSTHDLIVSDCNINVEALDTVFASLYFDRCKIDVRNLVAVVAAATWLQLEGLLDRCARMIEKHLCDDTVMDFCIIAHEYSNREMEDRCLSYLELRLFLVTERQLSRLPVHMLKRLVRSAKIFLIHIELDLYVLCRTWMYMQIAPTKLADTATPPKKDQMSKESQAYFYGRKSTVPFLETEEGKEYREIFEPLRYHTIMNDPRNINMLQRDNVIPTAWYTNTYKRCWLNILRGGMELTSTLEKDGTRCGRRLERDNQIMWRWTGFAYGFDLLVNYCHVQRKFTLKRNNNLRPSTFHSGNNLACMHERRKITFQMAVASFSEAGENTYHDCTDVMEHEFRQNEDMTVLELKEGAKFPLFVSLHVLVHCIDTGDKPKT